MASGGGLDDVGDVPAHPLPAANNNTSPQPTNNNENIPIVVNTIEESKYDSAGNNTGVALAISAQQPATAAASATSSISNETRATTAAAQLEDIHKYTADGNADRLRACLEAMAAATRREVIDTPLRPDGQTPLLRAVVARDKACIEVLMKMKASPHVRANKPHNLSPLEEARFMSMSGDQEIAALITALQGDDEGDGDTAPVQLPPAVVADRSPSASSSSTYSASQSHMPLTIRSQMHVLATTTFHAGFLRFNKGNHWDRLWVTADQASILLSKTPMASGKECAQLLSVTRITPHMPFSFTLHNTSKGNLTFAATNDRSREKWLAAIRHNISLLESAGDDPQVTCTPPAAAAFPCGDSFDDQNLSSGWNYRSPTATRPMRVSKEFSTERIPALNKLQFEILLNGRAWPLQPWLPEGMQSSFTQCFVRVLLATRGGGRMGGETQEVVINTWIEQLTSEPLFPAGCLLEVSKSSLKQGNTHLVFQVMYATASMADKNKGIEIARLEVPLMQIIALKGDTEVHLRHTTFAGTVVLRLVQPRYINLDLLRARRRMAQSFQFANSFVREECMDTHYTYLVPWKYMQMRAGEMITVMMDLQGQRQKLGSSHDSRKQHLGDVLQRYIEKMSKVIEEEYQKIFLELREHYMQSSPFRSSMQKKAAGLQCVPINAHLQLFSVMPPVRVKSSAASSSTGQRDDDIKVYDTVTWGAPAEHLDGFTHGGGAFALREKMNLYEAKRKDLRARIEQCLDQRSQLAEKCNSIEHQIDEEKENSKKHLEHLRHLREMRGTEDSLELSGEVLVRKKFMGASHRHFKLTTGFLHLYKSASDMAEDRKIGGSSVDLRGFRVEVDHWRSFGFRLAHKARPSMYLAANSQKNFYSWTERIKMALERYTVAQECFVSTMDYCARLKVELEKLNQQLNSLTHKLEDLRRQFDKVIEDRDALKLRLQVREDHIVSQALTVATISFAYRLQHMISNRETDKLRVLARIGFLMQQESLLSTHAKELHMLEDQKTASAAMRGFVFRLRPMAAEHCDKWATSAEVRAKCFSIIRSDERLRVCIRVPKETSNTLVANVLGGLQFPLNLPDGVKPGSSINFNLSELPGQTMEPMKLKIVEIHVPRSMFDVLPSSLQKGGLIKIIPLIFTQGINEFATFSNAMHNNLMQKGINTQNSRVMQSFFRMFNKCLGKRSSGDADNSTPLPPSRADVYSQHLMTDLQRAVTDEQEREEEEKRYEILLLSGDLTRRLGGGRLTNCKSGKDRTGMSVTLEQARILALSHMLVPRENRPTSRRPAWKVLVHSVTVIGPLRTRCPDTKRVAVSVFMNKCEGLAPSWKAHLYDLPACPVENLTWPQQNQFLVDSRCNHLEVEITDPDAKSLKRRIASAIIPIESCKSTTLHTQRNSTFSLDFSSYGLFSKDLEPVTLQLNMSINEAFGQLQRDRTELAGNSKVLITADLMRVRGVRLHICRKNTGKTKFAFNVVGRKLLPGPYKPGKHYVGSGPT